MRVFLFLRGNIIVIGYPSRIFIFISYFCIIRFYRLHHCFWKTWLNLPMKWIYGSHFVLFNRYKVIIHPIVCLILLNTNLLLTWWRQYWDIRSDIIRLMRFGCLIRLSNRKFSWKLRLRLIRQHWWDIMVYCFHWYSVQFLWRNHDRSYILEYIFSIIRLLHFFYLWCSWLFFKIQFIYIFVISSARFTRIHDIILWVSWHQRCQPYRFFRFLNKIII